MAGFSHVRDFHAVEIAEKIARKNGLCWYGAGYLNNFGIGSCEYMGGSTHIYIHTGFARQ